MTGRVKHDFRQERENDDELSLAELYVDLHETVHALADAITDTEVEARLGQLLAPAADGDPVTAEVDTDGDPLPGC